MTRNGKTSYVDDGGAEKSADRLYRRKRRRWIIIVASFVPFLLIMKILSYQKQNRAAVMERQKIRSQEIVRAINDRNEGGVRSGIKNIINESVSRGKYRWVDDRHLPPPAGKGDADWWKDYLLDNLNYEKLERNRARSDFRHFYGDKKLEWEMKLSDDLKEGPKVDYTKIEYEYPPLTANLLEGDAYPPLEPLSEILERWPQNDIDSPPQPFVERLMHFDFSDPSELEAATRYRDLELPFKVYNVPELDLATQKWTDEYLIWNFDKRNPAFRGDWKNLKKQYGDMPVAQGHCQQPRHWVVETMGPPPTKDNDFSFERWIKHSRYADYAGIPPNTSHYYWQSGVPREERSLPKSRWTFISRDLPSFSSPESTFFGFNPQEQKGIQCRFGERGVTAATHYDAGRNMVAMVTGAKRYILSPPKECPKLGIVTNKLHPTFRHSLLNFAHINALTSDDEDAQSMPTKERQWLELAAESLAIDTVLKAGEVLYIPSHWFHYITSLQNSAQCNTRSGRHYDGNPHFGGFDTVKRCVGESA